MQIEKFLELKEPLELQKYVRNVASDKKNCSSFYGSPKKHPYGKDRVILVADPFGDHTVYYDFKLKDIVSIEEQPRITNPDGESVSMVRLWVRKNSIGLQCIPFMVGRNTEIG